MFCSKQNKRIIIQRIIVCSSLISSRMGFYWISLVILTIRRNSWQQKQSGRKYIDTWPLFFETSLKTIEYILWNLWLKDPINSVCLSGLESSLPRLAALAAGEPGVCQSPFHQSVDCKMRLIAKLSIQLADTFILNSQQLSASKMQFTIHLQHHQCITRI